MATVVFEFWTPNSPLDAGTAHPLYFSVIFNGSNLARSDSGQTGVGQHAVFEYNVSDSSGPILSAGVRLAGLAPEAPDNWLPNRVKLTYGGDVLVDTPWNLPFDDQHRSYEIYRRAFDVLRGVEEYQKSLSVD